MGSEKQEIIGLLKARFEKNMNRHPGLRWEDVLRKITLKPEKLGSLLKMEESEVSRMSYPITPNRTSICFSIARRRVRKEEGMSVMTGKRWRGVKNTSLGKARWIWQMKWVLSC